MLIVLCTALPVNTTFDQNKSELRIFIFLVSLQVLSDGHGFLDKLVKILWDLRCEACVM